jgi:hypothetical protein
MNKKYFYINNRVVPFIGGGVESVGSTLTVDFQGSFSYNPNTSKSTDILFMQLAIGEGPIYRINSNGPQDIEIDGKYIDDLVDFTTNNTKPEMFAARYATGTSTQTPMPSFSDDIVTPVRFSSPVVLKSGISTFANTAAPPVTNILFYQTNNSEGLTPIDSIKIKFNVLELKREFNGGSEPAQLSVVGLVHEITETSNLNNYIAGGGLLINSIVNDGMAAELELRVPEDKRSSDGYGVSILKISEDIAETGYVSEIEVIGFDEIRKEIHAYPKTALAGYAVKTTDFRTETLPTYTSAVKGMIVDVPSNYNQPILANGEVDWRQVEVPPTGSLSAAVSGYRTQKNGSQLLTSPDKNIYEGIWDGTYKKDWTENRVWIIRHLLVNVLRVPESSIDKYNFYNAAQYVDAVDPETGNFIGVTGYADGSFRYKPNGYLTEVENILLGLPEGTEIRERRFVCGLSIIDESQVMEIITGLAAGMRAVFSNTGNKIRLIIDKADSLPVAIFNETNIETGSLKISGVRSEDIPTGIEVSYIDFLNHFEKETVVLDSSEVSEIERSSRISVDVVGCTRKSEALRFAQYALDSARKLKRKMQFNAFADASDLEVGDVIAVSHSISGVSYGFGGLILANSQAGYANAYLEHLTSPSINSSVFSANTNPLVLKIFKQDTNSLDYYLLSNTNYNLVETGNTSSGIDLIDVNIIQKLNNLTRTFQANSTFSTKTAPTRGDLWALGEIDPSNIYNDSSYKLFRIESISLIEDGKTSLVVTEYNSSLISDSDLAAKNIIGQRRSNLNYVTPPPPLLSLKSIPSKTAEGVINYNLLLSTVSDTTNYNVPTTTVVNYGTISVIVEIESAEIIG